MAHVTERPSTEPSAPKQPNPVLDYLEHMTPEEDAVHRYLAERDRETANDPDPDALPSLPETE